MLELLLIMLERLGLIVMLAFIATRLRFFRNMISSSTLSKQQEYTAILFFGIFGIIGTYSGVTFQAETFVLERLTTGIFNDEAIANFRVIGAVLGGLFGGYKVGAAAGLIAGGHRMLLGGFTAFSCGIATMAAGILAAWYRRRHPEVITKPLLVFFIGAAAEMLQMGLIVLLARPFNEALTLVQHIGLPMILANGIGCALFLLIIRSVKKEEEKAASLQAQKVLRIAEQTLTYLKSGLTAHSADAVCNILYKELNLAGAAMTDKNNILAYAGAGSDYYMSDFQIQTGAALEAMQEKKLVSVKARDTRFSDESFRLSAAVIAPLISRDEAIGTLKFYFHTEKEMTLLDKETLSNLINLLSSQLELAEADKFYTLAKDAEITALQAQINPHFLFNTLNTIISLVRLNPEKARLTLHALSKFIRKNLESTTVALHTLKEEIEHIRAYLSIEQIRFEDRIDVFYRIDKNCLIYKLPPLTLQPIIENAVKHGFREKRDNCELHIKVEDCGDDVLIYIEDNGTGVDSETLAKLAVDVDKNSESTGIALYNINKRLQITFGPGYRLQFKSQPGEGMSVHLKIPKAVL